MGTSAADLRTSPNRSSMRGGCICRAGRKAQQIVSQNLVAFVMKISANKKRTCLVSVAKAEDKYDKATGSVINSTGTPTRRGNDVARYYGRRQRLPLRNEAAECKCEHRSGRAADPADRRDGFVQGHRNGRAKSGGGRCCGGPGTVGGGLRLGGGLLVPTGTPTSRKQNFLERIGLDP